MKSLAYVLVGGLVLAGATADAAQGRHRDRDRDIRRHEVSREHRDVRGGVQIVFSTSDRRVIREHYRPRYRSLPPGLQKKFERTGRLPPGWQRRVEPFPVVVERRLPRLPRGYRRGVYDGRAIIVNPGGVIIDATIIF